MKRTQFGLALSLILLASTLALLLPGCKPRAKSGGSGSTETDNVLWRNELFDYAVDTLFHGTDEFYTAETQQRTINRLDQWIRLQKPLEGWQPDPVIAGVAEDLQAAIAEMSELAKWVAKVQQGDYAVPPDLPGKLRSAGERLARVGTRLSLLDILQLASDMVSTAEQVEKLGSENAATPAQAAEAVRALCSKFNVEGFQRHLAELSSLLRRIDPSILQFPEMDGAVFQEAVWLRNVASWASGEELDDPVKPAAALFDWVVKNVQLVREPSSQDSNPLAHVYQTPMETLLFGEGTGVDRAWLFVLLARQRNIDAALLGLVDENNVLNRLWGIGVLIKGEMYLFEPVLGLPIPKPGSQKLGESGWTCEPVTLAEAASNEEVFKQLDIFNEGDYIVRSKDVQRVVALVEASPSCLSQRMKMVEKRLTGDQKIVLTSDVTAQMERFKQSKHVLEGRMWPLPYQTIWQQIRYASQRNQWFVAKVAPLVFPPQAPILWRARSYHFKGQFTGSPSATQFYMQARQSDFATDSAEISPAEKQIWRQIKIDASYWLGLMVAQTGNYRAAEDYLKTRVLKADPGGKWEPGATYNLARLAEATGKVPQAIELLEFYSNVPQTQGNIIRASWLRKLTGQPPLKPRSEKPSKAPEDPEAPGEKKAENAPEAKQPEPAPEANPPGDKVDPEAKATPAATEKSEPAPAGSAEEPAPADQPAKASAAPDAEATPQPAEAAAPAKE